MKKVAKILAVLFMAVAIVSSLSLSVFAVSYDLSPYIEEKGIHTSVELEVGETHMHGSAIWVQNGGESYSSNDNVIRALSDGSVEAVGVGTAYLMNQGTTGMYQIIEYTVVEAKEEGSVIGGLLPVPDSDDDDSDTLLEEILPETEDEIESEIIKNKSIFGMIAGLGAAAVTAIASMGAAIIGAGFFALIWLLAIGILLYQIVTIVSLSKKSMGARVLPEIKETERTVRQGMPDKTVCPKCQTPFGEGEFCATCGISKKTKNVYVVPINKRMTAQNFEKYINEWLAENPYACNVKLNVDTHQSLFLPFVKYKFFVKKASIEFDVSNTPSKNQYGFAFLYKFRLFGPIGYSGEKHLAEWKKNNPEAMVVSNRSGRIQHFGSQSGFYAQYYNYVFYKKPKN
ncbi:MAG: hypothetical protein IKT38_05665 [Clostridia bacterium]|nr:hypothetical protein [Clostridia bacterium]